MQPDHAYPIRLQMLQLRGNKSDAELKSHVGKPLYLVMGDRIVGTGVVTQIDLRFPDYVIVTYMVDKIEGLVAHILTEEESEDVGCSDHSYSVGDVDLDVDQ